MLHEGPRSAKSFIYRYFMFLQPRRVAFSHMQILHIRDLPITTLRHLFFCLKVRGLETNFYLTSFLESVKEEEEDREDEDEETVIRKPDPSRLIFERKFSVVALFSSPFILSPLLVTL